MAEWANRRSNGWMGEVSNTECQALPSSVARQEQNGERVSGKAARGTNERCSASRVFRQQSLESLSSPDTDRQPNKQRLRESSQHTGMFEDRQARATSGHACDCWRDEQLRSAFVPIENVVSVSHPQTGHVESPMICLGKCYWGFLRKCVSFSAD